MDKSARKRKLDVLGEIEIQSDSSSLADHLLVHLAQECVNAVRLGEQNLVVRISSIVDQVTQQDRARIMCMAMVRNKQIVTLMSRLEVMDQLSASSSSDESSSLLIRLRDRLSSERIRAPILHFFFQQSGLVQRVPDKSCYLVDLVATFNREFLGQRFQSLFHACLLSEMRTVLRTLGYTISADFYLARVTLAGLVLSPSSNATMQASFQTQLESFLLGPLMLQ